MSLCWASTMRCNAPQMLAPIRGYNGIGILLCARLSEHLRNRDKEKPTSQQAEGCVSSQDLSSTTTKSQCSTETIFQCFDCWMDC